MLAFHDLHPPPLPIDGKYGSHLFYGRFLHVNVLLPHLCLRKISFSSQQQEPALAPQRLLHEDRKSTRLNSSHVRISYAVFCLKKKKKHKQHSWPGSMHLTSACRQPDPNGSSPPALHPWTSTLLP